MVGGQGADPARPGAVLHGRYRVEDKLAAGGMGTVFVAVDERLQRRVAVKLLRDDLASDPRFVERFRREARSVAALAHPNIATVFDYGEEDGRHFIVMELADGRDLGRVLREEGPFDPDRAVRVAGQICDALGHAHSAGVIHRDIKPANVIVGEQDLVKVTDFGIARATGDSTITAAGSILGSAHYLSPEQANGGPATPASDLYAVGIVVYEMLTGAVPFTGDSPVSIAMRHLIEEVPPPSRLNPAVSSELDGVVARATARAPEERWHDAAALAAALQGSLAPSMSPTEELGEIAPSHGPAREGQTVWPIPGDRWDPNRIGKIVASIFGVLFLVAVALVIARLNSDDTPAHTRAARSRAAARSARANAPITTPSSPVTVSVPNLVGRPYDEAAAVLVESGFRVERNEQPSEDVEEGDVLTMDPPAGSAVAPAETITLTVSSGEDKPAPPGHGGKVPPGRAKKKHEEKDKHK
jgi:eukaryotic-like serine/threonine-protein kinase